MKKTVSLLIVGIYILSTISQGYCLSPEILNDTVNIQTRQSAVSLLAGLAKVEPQYHEKIINQLKEYGAEQLLPYLSTINKLLHHENPQVITSVLSILTRVRTMKLTMLLPYALSYELWSVKRKANKILKRVRKLYKLSKDERIQAKVLEVLFYIDPENSQKYVHYMLSSNNPSLQIAAIQSIVSCRNHAGVSLLLKNFWTIRVWVAVN